MCEYCNGQYTPEVTEAADEAVCKGITWLDQNGPSNWRELINLNTLDIDSPSACILGQVFKDKVRDPADPYSNSWTMEFLSGYDYAVITFLKGHFSDSITGPLGFSEDSDEGVGSVALTEAWKRALTA